MRLTGFRAIECAEQTGKTLNKYSDPYVGPRGGLSIADAEAIASQAPNLIWLEVPEGEYHGETQQVQAGRPG